jgi:hypothetical protein
MKMAKASQAEQDRLIKWLTKLEKSGQNMPPWRRVVFGYGVLVENCADPALDYLEFKPEILAAMAAKKAEKIDGINPAVTIVDEKPESQR